LDSPVRRVTDAFASGDAIHWPSAERLAGSARARRLTRQLRLVAALAGESDGRSARPVAIAASPGLPALVTILTIVAIAQVVVAMPAALAQAGLAAPPMVVAMLGTTVAAVVASCLAAREPASPAIGLVLWLTAAGVARTLLVDASIAPGWLGGAARGLAIESFLPFALWRLAAETVPVVRFTRFELASRRLHAVALVAGVAMAVLTAPVIRDYAVPGIGVSSNAVWAAAALWAAATLAVIVVRSRGASAPDGWRVRRIELVVAMTATLVTVAHLPWATASALTWVVAAALPWLAARACAPVESATPGALRSTWNELRRHHASRDRDADLARLATAMHRARTPREVAATLAGGLRDTLGAPVVAVLARGEDGWTPLDGSPIKIEPDSALSALIERADIPVRVDRQSPLFGLLPPADRAWIADAGVEAVVRVPGADGHTMAGLLVGGRPDHRRYSKRDLVFTAAAATTAAIALDACARTGREIGVLAVEDEFAFECGACGRIDALPGVCRCGAPLELAALPMQLAGKFRLERRLGRGGMGVVYLAVDRFLGRLVALKTLPRLSARGVSALHAEARAMAALDHPAVAVVYGLEMWRDTPVLVAEYLARGTFAARLAQGPMPLREALHAGLALADTLADLHDRGWLHRDIKPSNIGIGRGGVPKLLDFGLTRLVAGLSSGDADGDGSDDVDRVGPRPLAGTPLYLSPEALDGQPVGEDVDVWALALVLFEMIAGTHPYRAATWHDVLRQARRTNTIDVRVWAPATPAAVADVITAALHPDRARRLATAREFGAALRAATPDVGGDVVAGNGGGHVALALPNGGPSC
jgi:hypothetical protein